MPIKAINLINGFKLFDAFTNISIIDEFAPKQNTMVTNNEPNNEPDNESYDEYMDEFLDTNISSKKISTNNMSSIEKKECDLCGPSGKIIENMQIYKYQCEKCGCVYGTIFDRKGEWSNYSSENSVNNMTSRCSGPVNNLCPKSAQGTIMSTGASKKLKIREQWNNNSYKEKTRNRKFDDIQKIVNGLGLENPGPVCESAKIMYRNFSETKHIEGKNKGKNIIVRKTNLKGILAACVFKACENNGIPRTLAEIALQSNIDKKSVGNGIKKLKKHTENPNMYDQSATVLINNHIQKMCKELELTQEIIDFCIKIANNYNKLRLSGDHGVEPIAAGIIYFVIDHFNIPISINRVCDCTSSSSMTIQKIFKELRNPNISYVIVNDDITEYIVKDILKNKN